MEEEGEEMDSLFEGMVLFNPNSVETNTIHDDDHHHHRNSIESDDHIDEQQNQNEPLDESLFSDLTLVSELSPSPISRSISKKKKRAGLRIGYARDADAAADDGHALPSTTAAPQDQHDSSELGLVEIKSQISDKLNLVRQLAASVSAARKDAISKRRKAAETLHKASNAYSDLESQLNEACKSEDFETTETLSQSLADAEAHKHSLLAALVDADSHCDAVESRMKEVLASQIAAEEECASLLHRFSQDASSKADLAIHTARQLSSTQLDQWLSSTESLELKKMELQIQSHIVSDARTLLNASIDNSVEDDEKERESLCKQKSLLMDELQELLALVKHKQQQIAETESQIEAVDTRIAHVVSGFQEMQSSIDSKLGNLQSSISSIEIESQALSNKKREIDDFLAQEEDKGEKLRELANSSGEEANTYQQVVELRKNLLRFVLKSREDKVRLAKTEKKLSDDVQMLQQEISTARASLQVSFLSHFTYAHKQRIVIVQNRTYPNS